jgi:hypothetical protein
MRNEDEGLHRKEPGKKKSLTMGRMCANRTTKPTPMRYDGSDWQSAKYTI